MINSQKVAPEVSEHLAVLLQRGQNPTTLTWFSFVNSKGQQLSLKCKNKYRGSMGPFGLLFYPGKDSLNFHKKQTPQDRNQGLSLLFCKCFFSQRWLQVQLSHSFLEQVKFGKTRWHLSPKWNSCSGRHHQHGNCRGLDDVPLSPLISTSASTGIASGSLNFQKLNFHQGKQDGKAATIQHSSIPSISFHVVSHEAM